MRLVKPRRLKAVHAVVAADKEVVRAADECHIALSAAWAVVLILTVLADLTVMAVMTVMTVMTVTSVEALTLTLIAFARGRGDELLGQRGLAAAGHAAEKDKAVAAAAGRGGRGCAVLVEVEVHRQK